MNMMSRKSIKLNKVMRLNAVCLSVISVTFSGKASYASKSDIVVFG